MSEDTHEPMGYQQKQDDHTQIEDGQISDWVESLYYSMQEQLKQITGISDVSEFSTQDALDWLQISINKNCTVQQAIYYSLYFECVRDEKKFTRALEYFCREMKVQLPKSFRVAGLA